MLPKKFEVRLRVYLELVDGTYPRFDASSSREPGIAHQPHINL
jgi:hypothetical protein